mgnify:CR=1 FL=1
MRTLGGRREALAGAVGDRLPGIRHAVVQHLQRPVRRAAADHQAEIGQAEAVAPGLERELGPVGLLVGTGLGASAVREVGHRVQVRGEALEASVQGVMTRRPPVGGQVPHRLLAFPEGLDHGQPIAGQQGLFTPAHAPRQVQGFLERVHGPPAHAIPELDQRQLHAAEGQLPLPRLAPLVPEPARMRRLQLRPGPGLDRLQHRGEQGRGRQPLEAPEGQRERLKQRGRLGDGHFENQMDPQRPLGLDGGTSSSGTVSPSFYPSPPSCPLL